MQTKIHKIVVTVFLILVIGLAEGDCVHAEDFPLPDTGQTQCYDDEKEIPCPQPGEDFYGQDGNYAINPRSYTKMDAQGNDQSDDAAEWAMVRDNVTGLIWEVKTDDGSVHDKDNTYTWYDSNAETNGGNAGTPGDGTDTEDFINALNAKKFGGFSDWRIPTIRELSSLVDIGRYNPAIDTEYFGNTPGFSLNPYSVLTCYWSSTPNANIPEQAWFTMFAGGSNDYYYRDADKSKAFHVRAVRGSQDWTSDHFSDNGDGTITDTHTGLMWQKLAFDSKMNWKDALAECENLSFAGYDDWRLPSIAELRPLLDYTKHGPSSDTEYFPDVKNDNYWASTSDPYGPGLAWYVSFSDGIDGSKDKSDMYHVRVVRGGFPQAGISGTPDGPTEQKDATLRISGNGIVSYRYKVNEGDYSEEMPATEPIILTNLVTRTHTVHVLGKNLYGTWQPEDQPTTVSWKVTSLYVDITSPEDGISVDDLSNNVVEIRGTASAKQGESLIDIQITDGEYYLDSQGRLTLDETWLPAEGTESWSFNVSHFIWKDKNYTITARNTDSTGDMVTDSITILACQPSEIICKLSSDAIHLGEEITLSGQISPSPSEAGKGVSIEFTSPSEEEIKGSANANIDGAFEYSLGCDKIQAAGTWTVRASWTGDERYCGAVSEPCNFTVSKATGKVLFDTNSSVIKLGESVAISGMLTHEIECEMDLSGIPIVLNVFGPNDETDAQTVYTNEEGHFLTKGYAGLDGLGRWTVTAILEENGRFEAGEDPSDSMIEINVRETAGYAIIIQGWHESEAELDAYSKTTQFVYATLTKRNLLDDDINYLNYEDTLSEVDDISSKTKIEDAVTQWAANKMNEKPANLYIVMVDHGSEGGNFHLHNSESIRAEELGAWIDTLRDSLEGDAKYQEIVVIMGFCYSGSFIPELSGDNRVIIASSDSETQSVKGPEEDGEIRQGDYFMAEFFNAVSSGKSVKSCFEAAAKNTDSLSSQNPLLNDDGNGEGSNDLLPVDADGSNSADIYIGTGMSDFNAIDDVSITEVSPTLFVGVDETSTDQTWARVENRDRLRSIWVHIKKPNYEIIGIGGTGQVEMDLEGPFFSDANDTEGRYEWHNLGDLFSEPGTYQIFYYAKDDVTGNVSSLMETRLYKDKPGNRPPLSPSLLSPQNGENIMTGTYLQVKLDWADVEDPDGDNFSYTLILSQNSDFSNPICKEDLMCSARLISKFDGIDTGPYYWKVRAIDKYGAFGESETGEFNIFDSNPREMWVGGHIWDIFTHLPIPNVSINILGTSSSFHTDMSGCYLERVDEGNTTFSVEASGYNSEPWTLPKKRTYRTDDLIVTKNFKLTPSSCDDTITGDVLNDCTVDLKDAVLTLKILSAQTETAHKEAALDGKKITLGDAVSILRTISEK